MFRRVLPAFVAVLLVMFAVACGEDEVSLDPPEIRYGEDISEMGMFVVRSTSLGSMPLRASRTAPPTK